MPGLSPIVERAQALAIAKTRAQAGCASVTTRNKAGSPVKWKAPGPLATASRADRYVPPHSREGYVPSLSTSERFSQSNSRSAYVPPRSRQPNASSGRHPIKTNFDFGSWAGTDVASKPKEASAPEERCKMSYNSYVDAVNRLKARLPENYKEGSIEHPKVHWLHKSETADEARRADIESICYDVCIKTGVSNLWIRCTDHNETRAITRTRTGIEKRMVPDDPHITAHMGNSLHYEYDAHIYVAYEANGSRRLARPEERTTLNPDGSKEAISILDRRELRALAYRWGTLVDPAGGSGSGSWRTQTDAVVVADAAAGIGFEDVAADAGKGAGVGDVAADAGKGAEVGAVAADAEKGVKLGAPAVGAAVSSNVSGISVR
ncbi:uncharacterized protein DSM5745_01158 [Aspergillus mulundensis]|uniref:Uncharacterized protein n=1 Tax=Aspergillus mulundensis TaxID=1810919 RepID=A0A3D8T5J4_9EURO|nr:hypothetical protein DSM5745_01158 [Aspergillus mulundensis]RDW93836.1 hypothetical protein DSM5745_01158 [Aspergillus mulundensis]